MDNYQGDLTDIIRASGAYGSCCGSTVTSSPEAASFLSLHHWQWQLSSVPEDPSGNFGDPFSNMRDPFLVPEQLDMPAVGSAAYFNSASTSAEIISSSGGLEEAAAACFGGSSSSNNNTCVLAQKTNLLDQGRPNSNSSILPNMMQISSNNNSAGAAYNKLSISPGDTASLSSRVVKPSAKMIHDEKTSKDHCLVTNTGEGVLAISSPVIRNPGLKRRKSQGKKSICIPAPADLNSRQSGEVVPSDLWAWRKYGQKPIKGSPYPRGYYRCSSSKGCPARKQVERSMTDPKMLVITYSSDHNHQWPTQRNALAGSTRSSQPSKTVTADYSKKSESSDHIQPQQDGKPPEEEEQQQQQESNSDSNVSPPVVKEEQCEGGKFSNNGISNSKLKYCSNQVLEDLFTDHEFGEMEAEYSPNLILSPQGFDDQQREHFKALHPFHHI